MTDSNPDRGAVRAAPDRHRLRPDHRQRDPVRPHPGRESRLSRPRARRGRHPAARGAGHPRCRRGDRRHRQRGAARFDYVFTTGGIGPTHDDITAQCVAAPLACRSILHPDAKRLLETHYPAGELNEARMRMAMVPEGAALLPNPISRAPGFRIGNVFVMAGVPSIMQGMFEQLRYRLVGGAKVLSRSGQLRSRRRAFWRKDLSAAPGPLCRCRDRLLPLFPPRRFRGDPGAARHRPHPARRRCRGAQGADRAPGRRAPRRAQRGLGSSSSKESRAPDQGWRLLRPHAIEGSGPYGGIGRRTRLEEN